MKRPRIQRVFVTIGVVIVILMLVGATYQGVATALERRQFPRPGGMVDVGGHQLHIYCVGEGGPTVILEAPAAGLSAAWGWVQPPVGRATRVCSYDRAGLGWSEAADGPYEPAAATRELHALLDHAGERGPFVIVGHGLGAAFATLFASQFGDDTSALVLVDPPVPGGSRDRHALVRLGRISPWMARAGILRATEMLSRSAVGLPEPSGGALRAFLNRPDHLTRSAQELARWEDIVTRAADARVRPDLPVVRLQATGDHRVAFLAEQALAAPVAKAVLEVVSTTRFSDHSVP